MEDDGIGLESEVCGCVATKPRLLRIETKKCGSKCDKFARCCNAFMRGTIEA